jgi:glycerophosphoryl diester phosphodiesterase
MMLPAHLDYRGRQVLLKYHKFNSGRSERPPNSLSALDELLGAELAVIEFDVGLLAGGAFALLHDARLERETTGVGPLRAITASQLKALALRGSSEPPSTLAEVAARLRSYPRPLKVQVDLKEVLPLELTEARGLLQALEPLRENASLRVVVGCLADWNLRLLRRLDPHLLVGLDPAFYLHAPTPTLQLPLPTRLNAYGYVDDHPLGYRRALPVARYLEDRLDSLLYQLPGAVEVYLHKGFVAQALEDGFNPIDHLHRQAGSFVDVWTINGDDPGAAQDLRMALEAGADQITTDTAAALPEILDGDGR